MSWNGADPSPFFVKELNMNYPGKLTLRIIASLLTLLSACDVLHAGDDAASFNVILQPGERKVYNFVFRGGRSAWLEFVGTRRTDVDVFVRTKAGQIVAAETTFADFGKLSWDPPATQFYSVEFRNLGFFRNTLAVKHNGDEKIGALGGPMEPGVPLLNFSKSGVVPAKSKQSFTVILLAGKTLRAQMIGGNKSNLDLFIFDPSGREIASDERRSSRVDLVFKTGTAGTYRFEIRNQGNAPNNVSLTANYIAPR